MPMQIWRAIYPMGIHFGISQIVAYAGLYFLVLRNGGNKDAYYGQVMMLTGLTGLLALIPTLFFYKKDLAARKYGGILKEKRTRKLGFWEGILLFFMGGALAQYINMIVNILLMGSDASMKYQNTVERMTGGKTLLSMILWIGIVAPLAEEAIFRWLVFLRFRDNLRLITAAILSGVMFGIYHGNLVQGIYASILGTVFALLLEWSGSLWGSVLLHMGANIWSLISGTAAAYIMENEERIMVWGMLALGLLILTVLGMRYFYKKYTGRNRIREI